MQFLVAVAALHVSAIALYYAIGVPGMAPGRQRLFAWTWIVLTAAVVFGGLQRIRRARRAR
jgi:hypothetical protein